MGGEVLKRVALVAQSYRDGPKDQTRNLEIPGSRFARPGMTRQGEAVGWAKSQCAVPTIYQRGTTVGTLPSTLFVLRRTSRFAHHTDQQHNTPWGLK